MKFRRSIWPTRNSCASTKFCQVSIAFRSTALLCIRAKFREKARTKLDFEPFRRLGTIMLDRMKAVGHLAANRLFKPMVKKHLDQPKRYIVTRHCNRSKQKTVGTRRQSSESGDPRSPNVENTWDVPVFGKMKVSDVFKNGGLAVSLLLGVINTWTIRQQQVSEGERSEKEDIDRLERIYEKLRNNWREIAHSRNAVLDRHDGVLNAVFRFLDTWNDTNVQSWHGGAPETKKSTVVNTKPAPESFREVIRFFIDWGYHHNNKTIDSARLKEYVGPDCEKLRGILTEVRGDEAKSWDKADKDNLEKVVNILDKLLDCKSGMELQCDGQWITDLFEPW